MHKGCELVSFFVAAFIAALLAVPQQDYQFMTLKMLKCQVEAKFAYQNFSCRVKSFNRSYSTFSIIGVTKLPLYDILASFESIFVNFMLI